MQAVGPYPSGRNFPNSNIGKILWSPVVRGSSRTPTAAAMKPANTSALLNAFQGLRISASSPLRQLRALIQNHSRTLEATQRPQNVRAFSTTTSMLGNWLEPNLNRKKKMAKGRPRVATGGSTKGTTVIWGDYGLRMTDHHRRISAKQLKMAEDTIKTRLRGQKYRLYKRKCCNVGVYVSGNDVRFSGKRYIRLFETDYWADAYG